jgi:Uncharacterized protein conserved in bacteria
MIYLYRRDHVAQAVSKYIAGKTGVWHVRDKKGLQRSKARVSTVPYMFEEIYFQYLAVLGQQFFWERVYQEIIPHKPTFCLAYEDYVQDLEGTTRRILKWAGVPVKGKIQLTNIRKNGTDRAKEFCSMFRADLDSLSKEIPPSKRSTWFPWEGPGTSAKILKS